MKILEIKSANACLAAVEHEDSSKSSVVTSIDLPTIQGYFDSPAAHTYVADEMLPMPASFEFALTDTRAVRIPEGAKFCGIYFKHFLNSGNDSTGQPEFLWTLKMRVLGLVPHGSVLKPLTVIQDAYTLTAPLTFDSPALDLQYFEHILDASEYQRVMSNMCKMLLPPGISHVYPLFRYLDAVAYPPLTGPLTFHIRFW